MSAKLHACSHIYLDNGIFIINAVLFFFCFFVGVLKNKNIFLYSSISPLGLVLKHTHRVWSSEAKETKQNKKTPKSVRLCRLVLREP